MQTVFLGSRAAIHRPTNRMQQILKALDNMQQSLYWLRQYCARSSFRATLYPGVVPDSIESNSRCERRSAFRRTSAGTNHARKAFPFGGRKTQSQPAKAAPPDSG